jgi:hypothetical protein
MDDWLILQNFCNGLNPMSRDHMDAAAGGAFFSKTVQGAVELIEKMVSNMGWSMERLQTRQRGMHTVKETELLAAKLDLLMKRLDDHEKRPQGTVKAWTLTLRVRSAATRDILGMIARKPMRRRCTWATTTTGIAPKEVRGGTNHAHIIKEVIIMVIFLINPS